MKKILVGLFSISILVASCGKTGESIQTCTNATPASEDSTMQAFCTKDTITATKDPSGLYYQVITPGVGPAITLNSTVSVTYTGSFLDGTIFDKETSPVTFPLSSVIAGWQIGIPYVKAGGHIKLVVPSTYAYGCNGEAPSIPPNSILYFDVTVVSVQ